MGKRVNTEYYCDECGALTEKKDTTEVNYRCLGEVVTDDGADDPRYFCPQCFEPIKLLLCKWLRNRKAVGGDRR